MAVFDASKIISGTTGDDIQNGTSGDDVIYALGGADAVSGLLGHDVILGDDEDDLTDDGDDVLEGGEGNDILVSGHGHDTLLGGAGDDFLLSGVGARFGDQAWAGSGEPIFEAGDWRLGDILTLDGGPGRDRAMLSFDGVGGAVTLDLSVANAILRVDGTEAGTVTGIEELHFTGGYGDDAVTGTTGADRLNGGDGADTLNGGAGADTLQGDRGADILRGGDDNDALFGGDDNDTLDGGAGNDSVFGEEGDDVVTGGAGSDSLFGDGGDDQLSGGLGDDSIDGGDGTDVAVFGFASVLATWNKNVDGSWTVSGPEGVDILTRVEKLQFSDKLVSLAPQQAPPAAPAGQGVSINFTADPGAYAGPLRDYDGNNLGHAQAWKLVGATDIQNDGDLEYILINRELGRWATIGPSVDGLVYFNNFGVGGDTRVVGVYVDPLVQSGQVQQGGDFDSQKRFANDLSSGNLGRILGAGDFDMDGFQEIYFSLGDGTAFLHAYMHADGNIRYANYQSQQQVVDYMTANGWGASTWAGWFTP